ncbi:MAG: hypothetical protein OXC57_13980 [Rhodobacteraceae bacterium]|nr:hypothetical protein [Paracoccaceae bacterium]
MRTNTANASHYLLRHLGVYRTEDLLKDRSEVFLANQVTQTLQIVEFL